MRARRGLCAVRDHRLLDGRRVLDGAPGLDLPALDVAATAQSYGVPGVSVGGLDELHGALADALAADGPQLVQVDVAPGMALA
jgi:thiamine pyrophosphate-dependent acetolactate synthase large subunit-like protein